MEKWLVPRKYVICEESFRRAFRDGKPIGFSLRLRIPEYRSLPLALVGGFHIQVDGKVYENLTVTSEGLTFRPEEMETVTDIYWLIDQPITLTVETDVPLTPGKHRVGAYAGLRISYMPRVMYCGEELALTLKEEA